MCKRNNDALFFTCSLIEQLGRSLHMRRGKVAAELGEAGIQTLYRNADILHCEPIEKVADDVITEFSLQGGDFDNLAEARYTVPDVWTMGKVYARLIEDVSDEDNIVETILQVFTSWIDSLLSDYNAAFYYQPRDYIAECYRGEHGDCKMLYRNLLYTAISRARKEVILVGSREAVNTAMQCIPYPRKSKLVARTNLLRLRRSA